VNESWDRQRSLSFLFSLLPFLFSFSFCFPSSFLISFQSFFFFFSAITMAITVAVTVVVIIMAIIVIIVFFVVQIRRNIRVVQPIIDSIMVWVFDGHMMPQSRQSGSDFIAKHTTVSDATDGILSLSTFYTCRLRRCQSGIALLLKYIEPSFHVETNSVDNSSFLSLTVFT
jgi:hypothetical protein